MNSEIKEAAGWGLDAWLGIIIGIAGFVISIVTILLAKETRENAKTLLHRTSSSLMLAAGVSVILFLGFFARSNTTLFIALGAVLVLLILFLTLRQSQTLRAEQDRSTKLEGERNQAVKDLAALQETTMRRDQLTAQAEQEAAQRATEADERAKTLAQRRWNSISKVTFGHLPYEPFLTYYVKDPGGPGVALLKKLLRAEVQDKPVKVEPGRQKNWGSILEGLEAGEYDVVATPLFATSDRCKRAAFTSPLFFSNVGLDVSEDVAKMKLFQGLTADNMKAALIRASSTIRIRFLSVDGEISERLSEKYAVDKDRDILREDGNTSPLSLLEKIANETEPLALFCESFYADDKEPVQSNKVVNLLRTQEILYPVGYAVRRDDYHLKNLLNIRLLGLDNDPEIWGGDPSGLQQGALSEPQRPHGGAFYFLTEELKADAKLHKRILTDEYINKHFVASWPIGSAATTTNSKEREVRLDA